jgi:NADP-dependent aldehyde dehydrogenase
MSNLADATLEQVRLAMSRSKECFGPFRGLPGKTRSNLLKKIAEKMKQREENLLQTAERETALGERRLGMEFSRTISEIELFADFAEKEQWKARLDEKADPLRNPLPKSAMTTEMIPVGPVVVIGACNFPFAISVVGTDTISALAVGCPVVVKSHPEHGQTCQSIADLVTEAIEETNSPRNCFQLLHGKDHLVTQNLVKDRNTSCVAFTGSLLGGQVLASIAANRPSPIPFHAEMGSLNPVFALPHAIASERHKLAQDYLDAVNLFAGQMCTKPGVLIAIEDSSLPAFLTEVREQIVKQKVLPMLNQSVYLNYLKSTKSLDKRIQVLGSAEPSDPEIKNPGRVTIFTMPAKEFIEVPESRTEAFGPSSIIVRAKDEAEMLQVASILEGSLTCSLHAQNEDLTIAQRFTPILESKCGRLLWNAFPPGVVPGPATHHGGPWPASTDSRFTSIGLQAYKRFVRPVCKQGFPEQP